MISWIQLTFQKHFRVLFLVLLAIVIVSFVFTIGVPGVGQGGPEVRERTYFGLNLGSPDDTDRLFGDAQLSVLLQAGFQQIDQSQVQAYALERYAGLHVANQLNLPGPSSEELSTFVRSQRLFAGADGQFDPQAYSRFRESLRSNPQLSEARLARVLHDDYRFTQVQKLLGGPGYVLDPDVRQQIARVDTSWRVNVATVDYTSFTPAISPTDADLKTFFDANAFRYEVPAQVRVRYVEFPAAAYAAQVNLAEPEIRAYYDSNPGRFPAPAKPAESTPGVNPDANPDADFAAVRAQVEQALRLERAQRLAAQAASDVTVALYDARATRENVEALLTAQGLTLKDAPPFSRNAPPAFLASAPAAAAEAFRLNETRPISDALTTPQGAVILVWQEAVAAHPAEFAAVKEQVRTDYLDNQRRQQFTALGRTLQEKITARVTRGEAFDAAVAAEAEAAGVKAETKSYGPFTRREPPQDLPYAAVNTLEQLEAGQVSNLVVTGEQGLLVHVAAKETPEIGADHARFAEVRTQLAQFSAARNASEVLRDLMQSELDKTEPVLR